MMTSVVAAGNGALSGGRFRGLAWEADVVLVKVGSAHRIVHDDIRRGIDWVIENRARYDIRVLNISCGGDYEESYLNDGLSRAADEASRAGIVVVAAVGNAGHDAAAHHVLPPASAPSVIAVGGLDDGGAGRAHGPTTPRTAPPSTACRSRRSSRPRSGSPRRILPGTPTASRRASSPSSTRPATTSSRGSSSSTPASTPTSTRWRGASPTSCARSSPRSGTTRR